MLRDIFKQISYRDSPFKDVYYLTDTEIRFSINDSSISNVHRTITISLRHENYKYIVYGFEIINNIQTVKHESGEINTIEEFWQWYSNFSNIKL